MLEAVGQLVGGVREGVGSNWVGTPKPGSDRLAAMKNLLGVPEELDLVAILPFGYPVTAVGQGKKNRKPFAEVVSAENYGSPFTQA